MTKCLICGQNKTIPTFNPGPQPLATLGLPATHEDAVDAPRFPMNFVTCAFCGHVFNTDFHEAQVPYTGDSSRMFNQGSEWVRHMDYTINKIKGMKLDGLFVDIGCGTGDFETRLKDAIPTANILGFEPGIEAEKITGFPCVRDYFIPQRDLKRYPPALLICRHVIEHMEAPTEFVGDIAYWAAQYRLDHLYFFVEVPCITNALYTRRLSDFLYEHVSNFTPNSLLRLFEPAKFECEWIDIGYNGEVIHAMFALDAHTIRLLSGRSATFHDEANITLEEVWKEAQTISGRTVLWGGSGKSAAFINLFGFNEYRFPFVVDSDPNKVGRFVPGTGQLIQSVEAVFADPVDTIIITTPWRAKDILSEIERKALSYKTILVLDKGRLNKIKGE